MRLLATALAASLLLATSVASAGPSEGERSRARKLAYEGQEALESKDFATAAARFEQADGIIHAPTLLLGLARAQVGLGKLVAGSATYRRILNEGVPPRSPQPWFKAVDEAKSELGLLKARIPSLLIQVSGPTAPRVTVDGAEVNASDTVQTDPGRHTVRATAEGFTPAEAVVDAREGATASVKLELGAVATNAPPPPPPPSSGSARKTIGFIVLGFGGAGLALGGIAGAAAIGKHSTLANECPGGACQSAKAGADLKSYHNVGTLSTIGFIGGGALAATGLVLVLTAPKPAPAGEAAFVVSPTGLGFTRSF
jgi:hypothetical protein